MQITFDPNTIDYKDLEEARKCRVCPRCGCDYEEIDFGNGAKRFNLVPFSYRHVFHGKNDGLLKRIFSNLCITHEIYRIYNFKCPNCGCEWESDPIKIADEAGNIIMNDSILWKD
jgi:hypothetical protein